jgi:hypothetical protein
MYESCPITFHQVDGTLARLSSFFIILSVIVFFSTSFAWILYILIADFLVRLYSNKSYSPIYNLALFTKKILHLKTDMVDGGAKRLAAYFGLTFMILLAFESFFHLRDILYITAGVFLSCAFLEVAFDFCIGCKIYFLIKKVYPDFMS